MTNVLVPFITNTTDINQKATLNYSLELINSSQQNRRYWCLCLLTFSVVTLFGNSLVVLSVTRERTLRNATNWFIVSLAVADISLAILVMPLATWQEIVNGYWIFGAVVCNVFIMLDILFCTASILNLVAISLDRYLAVTRPIIYAKHNNMKRVQASIAIVWLASFLIAVPVLCGLNVNTLDDDTVCASFNAMYIICSSIGSFYFPAIILIVVYHKIFALIRQRHKTLRTNTPINNLDSNTQFKDDSHTNVPYEHEKTTQDTRLQNNSLVTTTTTTTTATQIKLIVSHPDTNFNEPNNLHRDSGFPNGSLSDRSHSVDSEMGFEGPRLDIPPPQLYQFHKSLDQLEFVEPLPLSSSLHLLDSNYSPLENDTVSLESGRQLSIPNMSSLSKHKLKPEESIQIMNITRSLSFHDTCCDSHIKFKPTNGEETDVIEVQNDSQNSATVANPPAQILDKKNSLAHLKPDHTDVVTRCNRNQETNGDRILICNSVQHSPRRCRFISPYSATDEHRTCFNFFKCFDYSNSSFDTDSPIPHLSEGYGYSSDDLTEFCPTPTDVSNGHDLSNQTPITDAICEYCHKLHFERCHPRYNQWTKTECICQDCQLVSEHIKTSSGENTSSDDYRDPWIRKVENRTGLANGYIQGPNSNNSHRDTNLKSRIAPYKKTKSKRLRFTTRLRVCTKLQDNSSIKTQNSYCGFSAFHDILLKLRRLWKVHLNLSNNTPTRQHDTLTETEICANKSAQVRNMGTSRMRKNKTNVSQREKKATKTLAIVLGVFLACWLPFFTVNVILGFCIRLDTFENQLCQLASNLMSCCTWLGYVNSALNPIIYTIFNLEFRAAFKRILHIK